MRCNHLPAGLKATVTPRAQLCTSPAVPFPRLARQPLRPPCRRDIDEALRRRLEKRIYIPLPGPDERKELIKLNLKSVDVAEDVDFQAVTNKLDGYSGATRGRLPCPQVSAWRRTVVPCSLIFAWLRAVSTHVPCRSLAAQVTISPTSAATPP